MGALVKLGACAAAGLIMASGVHGHHGHGGLASLLGSGTPLPSHPSANVKLGRQMAARYGWTGGQWGCLYTLWQGESGWSQYADTRLTHLDPPGATVYAHGIPQSRPAQKMATAGADWATNPATQIRWGLGYIERTYGTPCAALSFKRSHGNKGY